MAKAKVFISYSSQDRAAAEAVHAALSGHLDVWRDQARIETNWSREIAHALADADAVCLLWSAHSAQSRWVKHEWLTARALEKPIIPCLLPGADSLPAPLYNLHGVPFTADAGGQRQLIGQIEKNLGSAVAYDYKILPPKSYIPFNPNPHFTGRHADLLDLYLKMIGNLNKIGINQVGTVGMGGIGKTQLAVEFACRFGFGFPAVYWVQATDPGAWLPEFVSIARDRLQLQVKDPDKPEASRQYVYALQGYFKEQPGALVVMDNVTEPKLLNNDAYLCGLTPLSLGCDLLFTTRRHFQLPGVSQQAVNVLSPVAAYGLMKSFRVPRTPADEDHARSICNAVGYLPLAITLAGAYLKQYQPDISFGDYRQELAGSRLDVIDIGGMTEEDLATRHVAAVGATLRSQWEMLPDEDARRLFKIAGQFPEAAIIPKARLGLLAGIRPGRSKIDQPLAKAFNYLHSLCLVESLESDAGGARLHPLVREFSLQLVPEAERPVFGKAAARNVRDAYFDYEKLASEIKGRGVQQVLGDFKVALDWWGKDGDERQDLELLEGALRLSAHVLAVAPDQLPSQLLGRLLNQKSPRIVSLLDQLIKAQDSPWLRPLTQSLTAPGGPLIRTLSGHTNGVMAVALTPDGRRVVSGSYDNTLKVWDLETGVELMTLYGHTGWVSELAVTPDGRKAISGSYDKTLKVWDLETGAELKTFCGHTDKVTAVAVTPDGRRAVSGSDKDPLKLWDLETGMELKIFSGYTKWHNAVAVTPDGRWVISGSAWGGIKVLDMETGAELKTLTGHSSEVKALAVTPDGRRVVSGSTDDTLKVWDLETGAELMSLTSQSESVCALAVAPDGRQVVSGSGHGPILKVWDLATGAELKTLIGHSGDVSGLAVTPDGRRVVSGSGDSTLKVWDLETGVRSVKHTGHTNTLTALAVTPDGRRAISGSNDKTLKVWELETGVELKTFCGHTDKVTAVAVTPDGQRAVSGSRDKTLKVWELETGAELKTLTSHTAPVNAVAVSPDGRRAISGSDDKSLKVWDLETGVELMTLRGPDYSHWSVNGVKAVALTPDGSRVVSWTVLGSDLNVWDLETGVELVTFSGHTHWINAVALTPDGHRVVSGSADKTLKVWDLETGVELMTLSGHLYSVSVAVAPDGRRVVSGSGDGPLKVWDLETGMELMTLTGHSGYVSELSVTLDGRKVVSGSGDKTLKVWDINRGNLVATFFGEGGITRVRLGPDMKTVVAGDSSGAVHFLRLENAD